MDVLSLWEFVFSLVLVFMFYVVLLFYLQCGPIFWMFWWNEEFTISFGKQWYVELDVFCFQCIYCCIKPCFWIIAYALWYVFFVYILCQNYLVQQAWFLNLWLLILCNFCFHKLFDKYCSYSCLDFDFILELPGLLECGAYLL